MDDDNKEIQKASSNQFAGAKICVGPEYQAVCLPFTPPNSRTLNLLQEHALRMWSPPDIDIPMPHYVNYISLAILKYNYSIDQALAMLSWHKHDFIKAEIDLENYSPDLNKFTFIERIAFEDAYKAYGKNFTNIQKMVKNRTIKELVNYYYGLKPFFRNNGKFLKRMKKKQSFLNTRSCPAILKRNHVESLKSPLPLMKNTKVNEDSRSEKYNEDEDAYTLPRPTQELEVKKYKFKEYTYVLSSTSSSASPRTSELEILEVIDLCHDE